MYLNSSYILAGTGTLQSVSLLLLDQFMPFVCSYNDQIHPVSVNFVRAQIDHDLRLVDGSARRDSIWKLWVRHISMAINRAASRNIQRKITKIVNTSNSAQRKASSAHCEKDCLSSSSSTKELEQNIDVLLLDQDMCQSQYADTQRFEDARSRSCTGARTTLFLTGD